MTEPAVTYDVDPDQPADGDLVALMARLLISIDHNSRSADARVAESGNTTLGESEKRV